MLCVVAESVRQGLPVSGRAREEGTAKVPIHVRDNHLSKVVASRDDVSEQEGRRMGRGGT